MKDYHSSRAHPAIPGIIIPGMWEVEDVSVGRTASDIIRKTFHVPAGATGEEFAARLHEYGRIKWSPEIMPNLHETGASSQSIGALEDARINFLLSAEEFPIEELFQTGNPAIAVGTFKEYALAYIKSAKTALHKRGWFTNGKIDKDIQKDLDEILTRLNKGRDDFNTVLELAKELDLLLAPPLPPPLPPSSRSSSELDLPKAVVEAAEKETHETIKRMIAHDRDCGKGNWGEIINIITLPLDDTVSGVICGFRRKASDVGPLCHPYRIPPMSDGLVFSHKKRSRGGTVLIDVSGSMCLSSDDVHELVKAAPQATVAMYSGSSTTGKIYILAKNGLAVKKSKIPFNIERGNVIDGPALKWMMQFSAPHIWVCDGHVTGINDQSHSNLTTECTQFVHEKRIIQRNNVPEAIELLKKFKRGY